MNKMKKFLACLLALVMIISLVPMSALAADGYCDVHTDNDSNFVCDVCGGPIKNVCQHDPNCSKITHAYKAPTCREAGQCLTVKCGRGDGYWTLDHRTGDYAVMGNYEPDATPIPATGHTDVNGDGKCDGCEVAVFADKRPCEHDWYIVQGYIAPTCTKEGQRQKVFCSVDNQYFVLMDNEKGIYSFIESDVIPAPGHNSGEPVHVVERKVTCTENGYEYDAIYCTVCEKLLNISNKTYPEALDHDWDEGKVTTDVTCLEDGEITYTCQREGCGETKTEPIAHTGHVPGEPVHVVERVATCTEDGYEYDAIYCTVCENRLSVTNKTYPEALDHDWDEGKVSKEVTCLEDGEMTYTCQREDCGETKTEPIAHTGHVPGEPVHVVERVATCTEDGYEYDALYCTVCENLLNISNKTYPEALDHDWDEGEVSKEVTCLEDGEMTYTCQREDCGETKTAPITAPGQHTPGEPTMLVEREATCTEEGKQREVTSCTVCKQVINMGRWEYPEALDHDLDEGEITTPATCVDKGVKTYSCQREGCDYTETETLDIDPDAHTGLTVIENANDLYTGDTHCASCGELLNKGEAIVPECGGTNCWYTLVEAKDATCVEKGNIAYYYCPDHNNYYSVEMEAITAEDVVVEKDPDNHTGETVIKNKSETYSGDTHCADCDALLEEGKVIAVPSTPITPAKPTWKNWLDKVINNWKDKIECPEEPTEPEETVPEETEPEETEPEETEPEETVPAAPVTPAKPNWGSIIRGCWNWIFR